MGPRKILIMGLPGAGKTTLARQLAPLLRAVVFDGDEVREHVNCSLGFSAADRLEHAYRMGWLCDRVARAGHFVIASFCCPTEGARQAFGAAFVVWVDRIDEGRFADTNALFEKPAHCDVRVTNEGSASDWALRIYRRLTERAGLPDSFTLQEVRL